MSAETFNKDFPARHVFYPRNAQRKIIRASEYLQNRLDRNKPILHLREPDKPCMFSNQPPDPRYERLDCIKYPKQSLRGYTYTRNADGGGLRTLPRIECLDKRCEVGPSNLWNYTRDFYAYQMSSCTSPLNEFRNMDVDTLKLLIPRSARYKTCSKVLRADIQEQINKEGRRLANLRKFELYNGLLEEELHRWAYYRMKPDQRMLYALRRFAYETDSEKNPCVVTDFRPRNLRESSTGKGHREDGSKGSSGTRKSDLKSERDPASVHKEGDDRAHYPGSDEPDIDDLGLGGADFLGRSLLKRFHRKDHRIVAEAIPHIVTADEIDLREELQRMRSKIKMELGLIVSGGDGISKYPSSDIPADSPSHSIETLPPITNLDIDFDDNWNMQLLMNSTNMLN